MDTTIAALEAAGLGFLQAICEAVEREMRLTRRPTLKGTRLREGLFNTVLPSESVDVVDIWVRCG